MNQNNNFSKNFMCNSCKNQIIKKYINENLNNIKPSIQNKITLIKHLYIDNINNITNENEITISQIINVTEQIKEIQKIKKNLKFINSKLPKNKDQLINNKMKKLLNLTNQIKIELINFENSLKKQVQTNYISITEMLTN